MSPYACVIVNPASANGDTGRRWPELRAALDKVLDRWDQQFTLGPGDATRLARQAVQDGYEMLVCVGGDGTMNEVVNGLFSEAPEGISAEPIRKDVILAPVRHGTGGDFARYLGLSGKLPQAVQHLRDGQLRPVDLGLVELTDPAGKLLRRAFLNIGSFGLSGLVVNKVNSSTKAMGGRASFFVGLMRALGSYRPAEVHVSVDGKPFYGGSVITCAVANGQFFGGGMHYAPDAKLDDGLFDVVLQTRTGLRELVSVADLYNGKVAQWDVVRRTRGQTVEVTAVSDRPVLVELDGEQPGVLPARFQILPSAARLLSTPRPD